MRTSMLILLSITGVVFIAGASALGTPGELLTQSKEKIRSLSDEQPALMDILLPDEKQGSREPLASISASVKSNSVYWIKKVVRARWLPSDVDGSLIALKDVKQWEKKDKHGVVFSERRGDFLMLETESDGYSLHIQESGASVSIRVDFAETQAMTPDPASFIHKCLTDFLNLPAGSSLSLSVTNFPPLYKAMLSDAEKTPREWWNTLEACTDGSFFFVTVAEVESGYDNPRAQPGLPDRF
ncbi:MAG: hypothetical protein KKC51_13895 [Verrucomicrobia bacterium]|nr:hypothetical protein [Verrucomicrobiota bacterium]